MQLVTVILAIYATMSAIAFIAYALDKRTARLGRPRVSEAMLHALELLGGWPGALLAQGLLRHKNAKISYQIGFWLIVVAHLAGWVVAARLGS